MEDLLFITQRIPYPPDKGDKIRSYHELLHLSRRYRVHLGCFYDDPHDAKYISDLERICESVYCAPLHKPLAIVRGLVSLISGGSLSGAYFSDKNMSKWTKDTIKKHQIKKIFIYCSAMAPYVLPVARGHKVILDMVDVDSEKWRGYAERSPWPLSQLFLRESDALFALEKRAALTFNKSLFVSKAEVDEFLRLAPACKGQTEFMDNGVDLEYFDPNTPCDNPFKDGRFPIVFCGTMNYAPNVEAVRWFSDSVLPLVERAHPNVEFWIVGHRPNASVKRLADYSNVHVTGRVADVRPYLKHAGCVVAPMLLARGVQNKILEAMSMARPVVATTLACEGLRTTSGKDVIVADEPNAIAESISHVLNGRFNHLGVNARAYVAEHHDWSQTLRTLDELLGDPTRENHKVRVLEATSSGAVSMGRV